VQEEVWTGLEGFRVVSVDSFTAFKRKLGKLNY